MKKQDIFFVLNKLDELEIPDKSNQLSQAFEASDLLPNVSPPNNKRKNLRIRKLLIAAVSCLLFLSGMFGYSFSVEAREYDDAVNFFVENGLSSEGLTKNEIKKVYRDITTDTFSYSKTSEVLKKSISGYEIIQPTPSPEELKQLWKDRKLTQGYSYKNDTEYDADNKFQKCTFSKLSDENTVWEVEFYSFYIDDYIEYGDKVFVYGANPINSSNETQRAYIALIEDGRVVWQRILLNDFNRETIEAILPNDSEIAVFSRGNLTHVCLTIFDYEGNQKSCAKNNVGNYGIWNAARLGDGYIIQLGNYITGEYSKIVKINSGGNITDSISYLSDDALYYITDMTEYGNSVYLSGYSVPTEKNPDTSQIGSRYDIASILNYIFENELYNISNEELTALLRAKFTAVLLICDPNSGEPDEFFSTNCSVGGKLFINANEKLVWQVENIYDASLSLATSAFTIAGKCNIYEYSFDENGSLIDIQKTDETTNFFR